MSPPQVSEWLFFLGVALMTAILLRKTFLRRKRQLRQAKAATRGAARKGGFSALAGARSAGGLAVEGLPDQPLADAPPEVLRWQVEMHQTARDLMARLDSKILILQELSRLADARIAALETLGREPATGRRGPRTERPLERSESRLEALGRLADLSPEQADRLLRGMPDPPTHASPPGIRDNVVALSRLGVSSAAIARRLNLPSGDVELLLSLESGGEPATPALDGDYAESGDAPS